MGWAIDITDQRQAEEALRQSVAQFQAAHTKGLEIATLIYPDVPTLLRGDVSRLRQILTNLVGNAIKFTQIGEIVIEISLQSATDTIATILFSVNDTGIGIAPDSCQKLFRSFSQVDKPNNQRGRQMFKASPKL